MNKLKFVKIGDVFKVASGGTPSREKSEYYVGGNIPWVKTGDLKGKYANYPEEHITVEALNNSSAKIFPKNTVLLAMYGATIGACSILPFEAATNQACSALLPTDNYDANFLFYYLKYIKNDLIKRGVGGAQPNISGGIIKDTLIPSITLEVQQKIANILDAADALRQNNKALVAKYDELTQALFLDMFGDPVSNPKGWSVFNFEDCLEIRNGKNQKKVENKNGAYPIYGSGGIMGFADDYISEANSVIIGRKGNINKPILVREKYWHVDTAFGLNPNFELLNYYYLYFFCLRYDFEQHNKTVTIPSLTKATLLKIQVPLPPIDLQNQFAERVTLIEEQKTIAQQELEKSEELFNSLLQKAFKEELV